MVGKFLAQELEGDAHAKQALGCADLARSSPRLRRFHSGGFILEHQGRRIYHAGDSAYFHGFKAIGRRMPPEIALLPIGAYHPESFRRVHMGPDQAIKAFKDLRAQCLVPMHYGTFRLSFEDMEEPPRWLLEIAEKDGLIQHVNILEEGVPQVF
jgi:L-ascorbate metabolism protein UlaG (beta-lactamase superfamily)